VSIKNRRPKIKNEDKEWAINEPQVGKIDYPIFCFKYLQHASIKGSRDADFFVNFLLRLRELSSHTWKELEKERRHGYGMELIPINQIRPQSYPSIVTPDIKTLTVFRANSDLRPFLGIRKGSLFHIIYIETRFGDIYRHG
jgi:hypothetical protein